MKAVQVQKPGSMSLIEVPMPEPPAGFARIKVKAAAICATDLEVIDGKIPANYPLIPGHEWSGIVDAVGSPEDAHWVGQPVIGSSDVACLTCEACRRGEWRYCEHFEEIGFRRDGAYGEYFLAPTYGLVAKPDSVPYAEAALCEPIGVALGTMKKAHAKLGQTLLIMGAGSIGLSMLAVGKAMGMRKIVVCDLLPSRLEIAKQMGAYATIAAHDQDLMAEMRRLHPGGSDVVIDATGIEECIQNCLKLTRKGGTFALAGYGRGKIMQIRIDDIHINNLKVVGAGNNWGMHKKALTLMEDGLIDVSPMVSEKIQMEDYEHGIELVRTRPDGFVKAIFVHD